MTALLGRNGSGKSTAIRVLTGLLGRDGGDARVLGCDPERLTAAARERIAWIADTNSGWSMTRVRDEVDLWARLRGRRWDAARAADLLTRFEVPLEKRLAALSKGQATRLRLAIALSSDPELLILDEPALGLDLFGRHDFLEAIIETVEREGRAVLIASHLIDDVERVADRIAFVRGGVVSVSGSLDELRDRFRRVRLATPPEHAERLAGACADLLGVERVVPDPTAPPDERVVVVSDFGDGLVAELEARSGARCLEVRRMTLREIYLEVLAERKRVQEVRS